MLLKTYLQSTAAAADNNFEFIVHSKAFVSTFTRFASKIIVFEGMRSGVREKRGRRAIFIFQVFLATPHCFFLFFFWILVCIFVFIFGYLGFSLDH